jgi:hypothetical protein
MNNIVRMTELKGLSSYFHNFRDGGFIAYPFLNDPFIEVFPFHVFHNNVESIRIVKHLINLNDVVMLKLNYLWYSP